MSPLPRLVLTSLLLAVAPGGTAAPDPLAHHRWQHRLLLVFAHDADRLRGLPILRQLAASRAGVAERHLRVYTILRDGPSRLGERELEAAAAAAIRRALGVAGDFEGVVLVGKDGGVKRRAALDEDLATVFGLIDTMPMRRREMAAQGEN